MGTDLDSPKHLNKVCPPFALKQGLSPFVILNLRQGMEEREAATGLSEAREAAEAIAELWIACFCEAFFQLEFLWLSLIFFVYFLKNL